jgi:hypothetical protein
LPQLAWLQKGGNDCRSLLSSDLRPSKCAAQSASPSSHVHKGSQSSDSTERSLPPCIPLDREGTFAGFLGLHLPFRPQKAASVLRQIAREEFGVFFICILNVTKPVEAEYCCRRPESSGCCIKFRFSERACNADCSPARGKMKIFYG